MFFNFCIALSFGCLSSLSHQTCICSMFAHVCQVVYQYNRMIYPCSVVMSQKNIIQLVYLRTKASQIFAIVHCQGNRLFKEGKFKLAKAKYEKVLFSSPYIASTFVWLTILFHAKAKDYQLVCFDIKIFWKMNHFPKSIFQKTISFSYV